MTTIPMEDVMPRRLALSILALAFAVACRGGERADDASMKSGQPPTLRQLAMAWSGGQTRPQCQDRGPNGEYLGLIQLSPITPPGGTPRLMVLATDMPKVVPDLMCPHEKVA